MCGWNCAKVIGAQMGASASNVSFYCDAGYCDFECDPGYYHCGNSCRAAADCPYALVADGKSPRAVTTDGTWVFFTDGGSYAGGFQDGAIVGAPIDGGPAVVLAGSVSTWISLAANHDSVFWFDNWGAVKRVSKAGGPVTTLADNEPRSEGMAADDEHVYWTIGGQLLRVPVDGGEVEVLDAGGFLTAVVVDATHVYWLRTEGVFRMAKSGGCPEQVSHAPPSGPALAVDGTHVYWLSSGLMRTPKTGGNSEILYDGVGPELLATNTSSIFVSNSQGIVTVPKAGGTPTVLPVSWVYEAAATDQYLFFTGHKGLMRLALSP
jgi:hypothetical protein